QDVARTVGSRATALLESRLRQKTNLERERMRRFTDLAMELAQDPEQMQLLTLLLDELYQQARPDRLLPDRLTEERVDISQASAVGRTRRRGVRSRSGADQSGERAMEQPACDVEAASATDRRRRRSRRRSRGNAG
ncbi:MAG: ATP-dependent helicase, partial [Deltaproteobacteria bacterium]|nr:ATP-dependent helicase [Deltaproteobacteria bacterium]